MLPQATLISSESLCGGPFGEEWLILILRCWLVKCNSPMDGWRFQRLFLDVGGDIVQYLTEVHTIGCNTLAISHDIAILAVAEYLQMRFGAISVPELGGIFISDDILRGS